MTNEQLIIYQAAKIAELEQNLTKVQERCDQFQKWWYELKTKEAQDGK